MKLNEIVSRQRQKRLYERVFIELYMKDYRQEFELNKKLYEGLEKSYPRQDVVARLKTRFGVYIYPDTLESQNILIRLWVKDNPPVQEILQFIQQQGWFISVIESDSGEFEGTDRQAIKLLLTSKYQQAILTIEPTHNIMYNTPRFLYHATLLQLWETKIKQKGLSPKSKSILASHPDRVYFMTTINSVILLSKKIAEQKLILSKKQKFDSTKFNPEQYYKQWVILEIDTSKITNIRGLSYFRVHKDPNVPSEGLHVPLYSQNYVPPIAIKVVKEFNAY